MAVSKQLLVVIAATQGQSSKTVSLTGECTQVHSVTGGDINVNLVGTRIVVAQLRCSAAHREMHSLTT